MKRRAGTTRQDEEVSHLFLVRLWAEGTEPGQRQWRGKVQNVVYGEARNFSDWSTLIEHMVSMLPNLAVEQPTVPAEQAQNTDPPRTPH